MINVILGSLVMVHIVMILGQNFKKVSENCVPLIPAFSQREKEQETKPFSEALYLWERVG
jgi:hypothetical protein